MPPVKLKYPAEAGLNPVHRSIPSAPQRKEKRGAGEVVSGDGDPDRRPGGKGMEATPHEKLHKDAVFATVFVMFALLSWLIPEARSWAGRPGAPREVIWLGTALAASLSSRPIYTLIAKLLVSIARSKIWMKRRYLGREFLHGTWFGILRTKRGHLRVYVEQYDQELDGLTIRGTSFRLPEPGFQPDLETKPELFRQDATWITRATRVNPQSGDLYCFYENNVVRKHYPVLAVGHFNIDYGADNFPAELRGYAIDVDAGIERSIEALHRAETPPGDPMLLLLELLGTIRLSYERVVKARRENRFFRAWPIKWFSDEIMTTEKAKVRAIRYFSREIEEELRVEAERRRGDPPA